MPTKEDLKKRVQEAIEKRAKEINEIGETVLRNPELGYKEVKTASLVEEKLRSLGLSFKKGLALTGLAAHVPGKSRTLTTRSLAKTSVPVFFSTVTPG